MSIRRAALAGLVLSTLIGVTAAAPAQAGGFVEVSSYDFTETYTFEECGTTIRYDGHFWGKATIRDANRSTGGQFFYFADRHNLEERFTDLETGRYITATGRGVFRELQPRVISDDGRIIEWITKDSGALWTVRDESGDVVFRDRGSITERYVFDSLGDSQPGGVFLDYEFVKASGQFPGADFDLCSLVR